MRPGDGACQPRFETSRLLLALIGLLLGLITVQGSTTLIGSAFSYNVTTAAPSDALEIEAADDGPGQVSRAPVGPASDAVELLTTATTPWLFFVAPSPTRHVIGGMEDLGTGSLRAGERTVASQLPANAHNRLGNWLNNRDVLRSVMREGHPIRDASVDSAGNLLYQDTRRFITLERDFLRSHRWRYDPSTQLWMPPG